MKNSFQLTGKLFILSIFILSVFSCGDDDDCCVTPPETPLGDVWIPNEGNFLQGNSSLSIFNRTSLLADSTVFQLKNNRSLGDVFQSVTFHNDKAYLIINNSQRIEVINSEDFSSIKTISDNVYSPRYGVIYENNMFVSDLSKPYLYVVDLNTDEIIDSVFTERPVEEMILHDNMIYGSGSGFATPVEDLVVVDPAQRTLTSKISVGKNPNAMAKDAAGMIWVVCDGVFNEANSASLHRINPATQSNDKTIEFTTFTPQYPTRLIANPSAAQDLYINGPLGVYKFNMDDTSLPATPTLNYSGSTYAIGIDPDNGNFYIGDSNGFQGNGSIFVFDGSGMQLTNVKVGIGPNRFYFR